MAFSTSIRSDIVVQSADGNLLALVEIKNREDFTPMIAAQFRRNLIAHDRMSFWARFFLIVSQDTGYLWDQETLPTGEPAAPTIEFPMAPVIERYLPSFVGSGRLSNAQLELAVSQWLWDIASETGGRPKKPEEVLALVPDFLQLMRGARVSTEIEF